METSFYYVISVVGIRLKDLGRFFNGLRMLTFLFDTFKYEVFFSIFPYALYGLDVFINN